MANVDQPMGLKPVGHLLGLDWTQNLTWCTHSADDSTAIFKGDPVTIVDVGTDATYPLVEQVDAGDTIFGVAVAFRKDAPEGQTTLAATADPRTYYCPASTAMYIGVVADPYVVYEVQEDSVGVNLAAANIMSCADVVVATGSTTTGLSAVELDSSSVTAADSTPGAAQLQILRLAPAADGNNAVGTNANWLVRIAEHQYLTATGL